MAYTDFAFYGSGYFGDTLTEETSPKWLERASDELDAITFASISSGRESISFSTGSANSSVYAAAATSAEAQTNLIGSIAAQYLANIPDANGVNLLYAGGVGRVPRHNNGL